MTIQQTYKRPDFITDVLAQDWGKMSKNSVTFSGGQFVMGQVVAHVAGKYVPLVPGANDDSAKAAAVCLQAVDAGSSDKTALAAVRLCYLLAEGLVWPDGMTDAQKAVALAQMESKFLIVQEPVAD